MSVLITSIGEAIEDTGLKMLVYGRAGAGKTVLGATTGEPTLFISAESGLLSIKDAPDYIKVAKVKTMKDLEELYQMLLEDCENPERPFQWVVLDSLSEIGEVVLEYEMGKSPDPRKAYGNLIIEMTKLIKGFRDLPNYDVLMVAKQKRITDDYTGITSYVPDMPGSKLAPQIPYLYDCVFALQVKKDEEGNDYRQLQTGLDMQYDAKDRSGKLEFWEEPSLKKIKEKINS